MGHRVTWAKFHADATLVDRGAIKLASVSRLRYSGDMAISLEKDATYDLLLSTSSSGLALAQTGCNLLLNGSVVATIQTHGALGKPITQKLCRIDITAGNYLLQFEATKPDMAIDWLEFRQVTD